jgi:hypothetical protein
MRRRLPQTLHKLIPKGWVMFNGEGAVTIRDSWNVTSVTQNTTGEFTIAWARRFGYAALATGYAVMCTSKLDAGVASVTTHIDGQATEGNAYSSLLTKVNISNNGSDTDPDLCSVVVLGV